MNKFLKWFRTKLRNFIEFGNDLEIERHVFLLKNYFQHFPTEFNKLFESAGFVDSVKKLRSHISHLQSTIQRVYNRQTELEQELGELRKYKEYTESEEFLDSVIERIKNKQL